MEKTKVLAVIGTRPEAIKLAPVVMELAARPERFVARVCATGQHRQMLDQALDIFGIKPDIDLDIMMAGQTLAQVTSRSVAGLDRVLAEETPDVVLVQGDTTTAFCGALAAYYHQVRVGHVEAGLRTGRKYAPFPEEINRRMVSQLADIHFAPTEHARATLLAEGFSDKAIRVTGNTVIDALLWVRGQVRLRRPEMPEEVLKAIADKPFVLVTGHRRESFGEGFEGICQAIREVAEAFPDVHFIYPVHPNPKVQEPVRRILGSHPRILLIKPLTYAPFVWLMDRACVILTDSGGVQEEAPSLGKPVLVMRETTERPEGVAAGNARLVGASRKRIFEELSTLLRNPQECAAMAAVSNPYGDGQAARRIVDALQEFWPIQRLSR